MAADHDALATMSRSMQAWQRALGGAAAAGAVIEAGELVGSVVPAASSSALLNSALEPYGSAIDPDQLEALAASYASAGISRWGLWLHENDPAGAEALEGRGMRLASAPTAMALDLRELDELGGPAGDAEIERTEDLGPLAEAAGAGYGLPPSLLTGGLPGLLGHSEGWLARIDGAPAAALAVVHAGRDAGVFMVATVPELRRRGAARATLLAALRDARERGRATSTLQSSEMGRPLYEALGYRPLGRYRLWEHRDA